MIGEKKNTLKLKAKKWDLTKLKLRIIIHNPCFSFDTLKLEKTKDQMVKNEKNEEKTLKLKAKNEIYQN